MKSAFELSAAAYALNIAPSGRSFGQEEEMSCLEIFDAEGGALVMKLVGTRLDATITRELRPTAIRAALGRRLVVVVLYGVTFIDSTGLGCLISVLKATSTGGQVRLVGVTSAVRTLLSLTRLERVLPAFGTVEDALAA